MSIDVTDLKKRNKRTKFGSVDIHQTHDDDRQ